MEKVYFPMKYLNVSQGYGVTCEGISGAGTYSHSGMKALDIKGADTGISEFYAPFTCKVKRITSQYNCVYFESTSAVSRRDGNVSYMTFRCMHISDEKLNELGITVGKVFNQGEICYYEGIKGGATGNHVHVEFGQGVFASPGCYLTSSGHYSINNPVFMNQVCWVKPDTVIMNTGGYQWVRETIPSSDISNTALQSATVGSPVSISNSYLYTSSTGTAGVYKGNETFYIYDGQCVNGRFRVCASPSKCGAGYSYVSGWVNGSDVGISANESSSDTTSSSFAIIPGKKVILNGQKLYTTSSGSSGYMKSGFTCFVYDGKCINNRYRVCRLMSQVNRGTQYVSGWVDRKDL